MPQPAAAAPFRHALFVYPYRKELKSAGFLPPIGLEFIAAAAQPYCRSMDLVDLRYEGKRTRDFLRGDTDFVGFSVNWDRDREFLEGELRSIEPGPLVVVGGRHATEDPARWLAGFPAVSAVVRGDGEEAMDEIGRGVPLERILGVSYRRRGEIVHNANRALGPLRDDLWPARRLRRQPYAVRFRGADSGLPIDMATTSRGCPFNCRFCSFSRNPWGQRRPWSARSPESVVDELATISSPLVGFTDDLFTLDMDRVARICDLIIERGIRKHFVANARIEAARRPDVLRKMERAGFGLLALGVESAHDKTLESMRKGFNVAEIRRHFKALRRSTMMLHGYFMIGNIGETESEMERIVPFARELGLDTISLSTLRSGPYTGLEELVAESPGYHITPDGRIYSDACSPRRLARIRTRLNKQFYSAGQYSRIVRKAALNGFAEFMPRILVSLPAALAAICGYSLRKFVRRS